MARPSFPARWAPADVAPKVRTTAGMTGSSDSRDSQPLAFQPARTALASPSRALAGQKPSVAEQSERSRAVPAAADSMRARMVMRLAGQGIDDARVLQAMGRVERHRFVDSALMLQAYEDTSLPIGLGQTISKPNVVARMIELLLGAPALQPFPRDAKPPQLGRVLEIGTGCGYQAAVLSHVAREVYSIERLRGLHDRARSNLRPLRLPTVHLLFGDGMIGFPKGAPYAGIIAAAGGESVPPAWIDQLAVGGRIVAPTQSAAGGQTLVVIDKTRSGITHRTLEPVQFVPLKSGIG